MTQLNYAVTLFSSLFIEALPFLLLGIFVSSGLLVFVNEHRLAAKFPRNPILGAIVGSSLGMLLPVCQYGNIPVTRRLILQGVPLSVAIGFLVAAPTLNPIVIWLTWKAFPDEPKMLFLRVLFAWLMGVILGSLFSTYRDKLPSVAEVPSLAHRSTLLRSGTFVLPPPEGQPLHRVGSLIYDYATVTPTSKPMSVNLRLFFDNSVREAMGLGSILALGCAIAAVIQVFLPQAELLAWGQTPVQQILVMLLLSVLLSLGAPANAGFVRLLVPNFLSGSLLAFLLLSSIADLKGIGLFFWSFRPKAVFYLLILTAQLTFLLALLLNFYWS
jgi:uncharacterized membrane protein YraQ (UPF0718 family)